MPDITDIKKNPTRVQPTIYIVQEMQKKESAVVVSQLMNEAKQVLGHKTEILKIGKVTEWVTENDIIDFCQGDDNDGKVFDYHQLATLIKDKLAEIFKYSEDNFNYVPNIIYILNDDLGIEVDVEDYTKVQELFGPYYAQCNVFSIAVENNQDAARSLWQLNDKQGVYLADVQSLAGVINGINKKMATRLMRHLHVHTGMQSSTYNVPWDYKVYQYILSLPGVEAQMSKEDAIKKCEKKKQSEGFNPKIDETINKDLLQIIIAWDVSKQTKAYDKEINEELARTLDYIQKISKVLNQTDICVTLLRSDRENERVAVFEMEASAIEAMNISNIKNHKVPDVKNKEQARKYCVRRAEIHKNSYTRDPYLFTLTNDEAYIQESADVVKQIGNCVRQNIIWLGENENRDGIWSCSEPNKLYKMLQTLIQRTAVSVCHYYKNANRRLIEIPKNSKAETVTPTGGGIDPWPQNPWEDDDWD